MRDVAGRLLAPSRTASGPNFDEVVQLSDRLRDLLIRLAGKDGFASLQQRALMLAKSDLPHMQLVRIGPDGRLTGFDQMDPDTGTGAEIAITTRLLELLVSVIGEPLTLRLLREAWPHSTLDE